MAVNILDIESIIMLYAATFVFLGQGKKQSNAQVDYIIQKNNRIIPIEVKSGLKGSMQSLYIFMQEKNSEIGIRTSLENFGKIKNIEIYPLYAISNIFLSSI